MENENVLASEHLRVLNVEEFFDTYAARSKTTVETLRCLTFTFLFAEPEKIVVNRGDME